MAENTNIKVTEVTETQQETAAENTEITVKGGILDNPFVKGTIKVIKIFAVVAAAATGLVVAEKIGESIGEKKSGKKDELDEVMDIVNSDSDESEKN